MLREGVGEKLSAGLMMSVYAWDSVAPAASTTFTVKVTVPESVGVPLTVTVFEPMLMFASLVKLLVPPLKLGTVIVYAGVPFEIVRTRE